MPQIKLNKRVIEKVKRKEGIYSSLSQPIKITDTQIKEIEKPFKELVTELIKSAFMNYAIKGHKADRKLAELEWNRFNKFLQKKL